MLTLVEIVENDLRGLAKQGKRAINGDGTCVYRADENTKCFIGWSIPDERYLDDFRVLPLSTIIMSHLSDIFNIDDLDHMLVLQTKCHDAIFDVPEGSPFFEASKDAAIEYLEQKDYDATIIRSLKYADAVRDS